MNEDDHVYTAMTTYRQHPERVHRYAPGHFQRLVRRRTWWGWIEHPKVQAWIAGVSLAGWFILTPITLVTGLRSSLEWVVFMSLFANVATCFGWWVSSLVNVKAEDIHDKVHE